jgi:hypothetical protein
MKQGANKYVYPAGPRHVVRVAKTPEKNRAFRNEQIAVRELRARGVPMLHSDNFGRTRDGRLFDHQPRVVTFKNNEAAFMARLHELPMWKRAGAVRLREAFRAAEWPGELDLAITPDGRIVGTDPSLRGNPRLRRATMRRLNKACGLGG